MAESVLVIFPMLVSVTMLAAVFVTWSSVLDDLSHTISQCSNISQVQSLQDQWNYSRDPVHIGNSMMDIALVWEPAKLTWSAVDIDRTLFHKTGFWAQTASFAPPKCPICLENVNLCKTHTICSRCALFICGGCFSSQINTCPACRVPVK